MKIKTKTAFIHILTVISGLYIAYYIYWRAAYTINQNALFFSIILLVAEIQGVINFLLFSMMTWNLKPKRTPKRLEGKTVDVFIPTYNEELPVLEATLIGCVNMRMPHTTYILDDGKRPEVRYLAEKTGSVYLTREDNKHAKAGNINAALKHTSGEFIVVLDADMVPQPDLLEKALGYFRDKKTAIVQLPQEFYNFDSFQHHFEGMRCHEQQLFYHIIQPGKDNISAAFWCGSPSVVRRAALESIGGVATDSITEDFLTSIRLNAEGWKIRYHHEALAFGIAPQSLSAFLMQRLRWAQGGMKILRSRDNPLIKKGLSFKQRMSHFAAIFTYFDAYQKLIYLLTPVILLFTGIMPIKVISGIDFMLHWIPYFGLTMLANVVLGRGFFDYFEVEKFNTLKMVTFIRASFSLIFKKNMKFNVTPKSIDQTVKQKDRRELSFHIIILSLIIASVLFALVNSLIRQVVFYPSFAALAIAIFWSAFNGIVLFLALHEVLKRVYLRKDYRFRQYMTGIIETENGKRIDCVINNISRGGLSLVVDRDDAPEGFEGQVLKVMTTLNGESLVLPGNAVYIRPNEDNTWGIGFRFAEISEEMKKKYYNYLFVTAPRFTYETSKCERRRRRASRI